LDTITDKRAIPCYTNLNYTQIRCEPLSYKNQAEPFFTSQQPTLCCLHSSLYIQHEIVDLQKKSTCIINLSLPLSRTHAYTRSRHNTSNRFSKKNIQNHTTNCTATVQRKKKQIGILQHKAGPTAGDSQTHAPSLALRHSCSCCPRDPHRAEAGAAAPATVCRSQITDPWL
jgi:hypothetical protein